MFAVFECVAQAIKNKGIRGLCEFVPGGPYILDVMGDAFRLLRERRRDAELRADLAQIAAASTEEAKKAAEEAARMVLAEARPDAAADRITLELYLSQIPGTVRASLKRTGDPSGKTVPPDFAVNTPEDLARLMPQRVPHFRPGADLPGRPGWKLDDLLGAGGFGEVWLARHTFLPHPRAVKFCTDPLVRTKLTSHEGKVIARVMGQGNHPNVVPLLDAVLDGETPWLMYEYVGGGSLTDLIHRWQQLTPAARESLAIASLHQLASAVGTFHRLAPPIVHRDLKPANVLVASGGRESAAELRITDFGIGGVAVDHMRTSNPVGPSMMTGWLETSLRGSYTPLYASPQQRAGNSPDPRDDVHALGVIGFQMLTGRLTEAPGIDAAEDLQDAGASAGLIALITKCVANKPDRRPKDAAELAEKLAELTAGKPVESSKSPFPQPPLPRGEEEIDKSPPSLLGKGAGGLGSSPTPLEGGVVALTPTVSPAVNPTKCVIPLRGTWYSRPVDSPDAPWSATGLKLPNEVTAKPGEAYRLSLNPDTTTNTELAKLKSLAGLPGLESIDLSGCRQVTDAGLMHLAHLRGLKDVGLTDTQVTDSGLTLLLARFPDLESVGLAGAENVTQTVIPYLARCEAEAALSTAASGLGGPAGRVCEGPPGVQVGLITPAGRGR